MGEIELSELISGVASLVDAVLFGLLAVVGAMQGFRHGSASSSWFAAMFGCLFIVVVPGDAVPDLLDVPVLALFPFFLYRFMRTFVTTRPLVDYVSTAITVVVVVWALAAPLPDDEAWGFSEQAFVFVFTAHWLVLTAASAWFFLRAARRYPGVARRRMRLFAYATILLGGALFLLALAASGGGTPVVQLSIDIATMCAAVLFVLALAPPAWLRATWRAHERHDLDTVLRGLVQDENVDAVRARLLRSALLLTGARGAELIGPDGEVVACEGEPLEGAANVHRAGRIRLRIGSTTPFFGAEELRLLETLNSFGDAIEHQVAVLERERVTNERLRQLDELKTEFVAMVAHDIRSPMSVITGFADTIINRWDQIDDERKIEYLGLISRNTRSLAEFVEDVLQVARMDSGELRYDRRAFDPCEVVTRTIKEWRLSHPDVTLTADMPDGLPPVNADPERTWQILTNLVSNAVKFSEPHAHVRVELHELREEHAVAFTVSDHGVGITAEDQGRLFRRFSRVGASSSKAQGTGLGLYIVKRMVEEQGGRIWVRSQPGEGSTFTYTLPVAEVGEST